MAFTLRSFVVVTAVCVHRGGYPCSYIWWVSTSWPSSFIFSSPDGQLVKEHDREGRVIAIEYPSVTVVMLYAPNNGVKPESFKRRSGLQRSHLDMSPGLVTMFCLITRCCGQGDSTPRMYFLLYGSVFSSSRHTALIVEEQVSNH